MAASMDRSPLPALHQWLDQNLLLLKRVPVDLSLRQTAILLKVYLSSTPQTIKSLADALTIGKPAVCRAVDNLAQSGLVRRRRSETDRRIVHIQRTVKGSVFLSDIAGALNSLQTETN